MGIQKIQNIQSAKIKTPTRSNNAHLIKVAEEYGIPSQSLYNYTRKGEKRRNPNTGRGRPSHVTSELLQSLLATFGHLEYNAADISTMIKEKTSFDNGKIKNYLRTFRKHLSNHKIKHNKPSSPQAGGEVEMANDMVTAVGEQKELVKLTISDEKNAAFSRPNENREQPESIESPSPHAGGGVEMANDAVLEHKSEEELSPPNKQCESIESQPPHVNGEVEMANGTVTQQKSGEHIPLFVAANNIKPTSPQAGGEAGMAISADEKNAALSPHISLNDSNTEPDEPGDISGSSNAAISTIKDTNPSKVLNVAHLFEQLLLSSKIHTDIIACDLMNVSQGASNACAGISVYTSVLVVMGMKSVSLTAEMIQKTAIPMGKLIAEDIRIENREGLYTNIDPYEVVELLKNIGVNFGHDDGYLMKPYLGDVFDNNYWKDLLKELKAVARTAICEFFSIIFSSLPLPYFLRLREVPARHL